MFSISFTGCSLIYPLRVYLPECANAKLDDRVVLREILDELAANSIVLTFVVADLVKKASLTGFK